MQVLAGRLLLSATDLVNFLGEFSWRIIFAGSGLELRHTLDRRDDFDDHFCCFWDSHGVSISLRRHRSKSDPRTQDQFSPGNCETITCPKVTHTGLV